MSSPMSRPEEPGPKLDFLERRVTLLERELARLGAALQQIVRGAHAKPGVLRFECDAAELRIAQAYSVEYDETGATFRWVGGEGPLQFVVPVSPPGPGRWTFHIRPHHHVDLASLRLTVDDRRVDFAARSDESGKVALACQILPGHGGSSVFLFEGLTSIRPSQSEGLSDTRLLAFRFYALEHQPLDGHSAGAP